MDWLVRAAEAAGDPLTVDTRVDRYREATEVTIYTADHAGLFSRIAGAMAVAGASIDDHRRWQGSLTRMAASAVDGRSGFDVKGYRDYRGVMVVGAEGRMGLEVRAALDALTLADDGVDGSAIYLYGEGWNFGEVADNARFIQALRWLLDRGRRLRGLSRREALEGSEGRRLAAAAMLAAGLVCKQHLLYAPIVLGLEGVPSVGAAMTVESGEWSVVRREILGDDTLLELEDRRATDALREVA